MSRLIAVLLALLLSAATFAPTALAEQPAPASIQALVGPFFTQLATLRGRAAPGSPPPVVMRSRSEIRRYAEQELGRKYPALRLEAERKAMVAWGLIPPNFDLRGFLADLLQEQAAAYYDPVAKVMVLADWLAPEEQQAALLHELVHALQDRDVSLDRFLAPTPGKGDQLLARQALVEGEAVALSLEVLLKAQGLDLARVPDLSGIQQLATAFSTAAGPVFARAPKFLQQLLLFPYVEGLVFVHQFRLKHPWSAVDQLYRDPPRSTTQILHPEKFLGRREDPVPIAFRNPGSFLGSTWRLVSEDELGEWGLSAALGMFLDEAAGRRLATGWRGDRYQVWEDPRGQLALIYRVRWEGEEPAEAFARAVAGLLEKKYPALGGKGATGPGPLWSWQEGAQSFLVERRGSEVLVLERVPATALKPLSQALWSSSSAVLVVSEDKGGEKPWKFEKAGTRLCGRGGF